MLRLKITHEAVEDLYRESTIARKCTKGLPPNAKLLHVTMDANNMVIYTFDDGKEEIVDITLEYVVE